MAIEIKCASILGVDGIMVNVEIDICYGLPSFNIVGLGDTAVKESKDRVRAAIINSDFEFPVSRITINLAPAHIKKEGSHFDLAIAVGILVATNQITCEDSGKYIFIGELSLNGKIKRVKGVLPIVIEGVKNKIFDFIIPMDNRAEGTLIEEANIFPVDSLKELKDFLLYKDMCPYKKTCLIEEEVQDIDFQDVIGQEAAKRGLEVAVSGNHNIILYGDPGAGKTMLAERITTIMPPLSYKEYLEISQIHSVSGTSDEEQDLKGRPFRNPHHTITNIALIGGGRNPVVGEVSLAHRGVLFLDELLEFNSKALQVLRQPLEQKQVKLSRVYGTVTYPANFLFVGALNPCHCGYHGSKTKRCRCNEYDINRYLSKLSGPILDRVDMFIGVSSVPYDQIVGSGNGKSSKAMKDRILNSRAIQRKRFENEDINYNSEMSKQHIEKYCVLDEKCSKILEFAYRQYGLSTRVYIKLIKLARTIADLEGSNNIGEEHLIEALEYRKYIGANIV